MTYYKTTIVFEVLTDEPLPDELSLGDIVNETIHGGASGEVKECKTEEVSREAMAQLLIDQGSDPEFLLGDDEEVTS
jgi:hypothetical protein